MELAELAISVDSRDVKTAEAELKRLTETGARTERAMDGVGAGGKEAARGSDAAAKSSRDAQQAMERQRDAAQRLTATVRYFAVAAAAAGAASVAWIMRMSDSIDSTAKMAEQIGVTTEALTGMRFAAQQFANISDQQFDMSMRRMTRRIAEAAQGTGSAKGALEELGLSAQQLARMTPDQQMLELADAMARTEHQADRLRYTMALFDTEGMALVPALQQGSRALEENIRLAERYGVVISTEAAQAAASFRTEVDRLKAIVWGFSVDMANQVLPTLSEFIRYAIEAATEVDGVHSEVKDLANDDSFKNWFDAALVGLARVGDVAVFVAKAIGTVGLAFQAAAADVKGALALIGRPTAADRLLMPEEQYSRLMAEYEAIRKQQVSTTERFNQMLSDLINKPLNMLEQAALRAVNTVRVTGDAYEVFTVDLTSTGEAAGATAEQMQNLESWMARLATPAEQLEAALAKAREELGPLFTPEIEQRIRAQYAAQKMGATVMSDAARAAEEFARAREQALYAQYTSISAIHEEAEALELQNEVFGLSRDAIERLHIARLEEQAAILRGFGGSEQQIALIEAEIEARKRLRDAMGERESLEARLQARTEEQRARDEYLREWERTNEQIGQSLTDALLRGFEDGQSFAENFRRTLENMFQTLVLRPIIQPVVQRAAGAITGALGLGGSAPGSGVPPGLGNIFSGLGQAISGASVGASGLSLGVANLAGRLGGDALGTLIGMNAGWSGVGGAASGLAGAAGTALSAVGSALPWIGAGITAYSLLKDAFSGETRYGAGYGIGHEGIAIRSGGPSGGDPNEAATRQAIEQTWRSINDLVGRLGGSLAGFTMGAGWELSPEKGRSFVWTDIVGPGEFVSHTEGIGRRDLPGVKDGNVVAQEFATELQRTLIRGLQLAEVDEHWREWIGQFDVDQLDTAGVQSVIAMIEALIQLQQAATDMGMSQLADATAQAQANIIELSGGIDAFSGNLNAYYQAFYSEAERTANLTATLTRVVGELGYELPRTHAGFRDLVESLDLSTESGQQAYATLIGISGAFDQLVQSLDSVGGTVDAAFSQQLGVVREMAQETNRLLGARNRAGNLLDRINRNTGFAGQREAELWAAMSTASYEQQIELAAELTDIVLSRYDTEIQAAQRLQDMGRSLRDYLSSLATSELAPTDLATKVAEAERQLNEAVAKARRGDEDAMAQIQGLTQNALELWRRYGASGDAYQDAYYRITGSVGDLADAAMSDAQRQLSVSQESLDQLEQLRGVAETAYAAIDAQYQASLEGLQNETSILTELGEQTGRLNEMGDILRGIPAEIAAHLQPIMSGAINNAVSGLYTGTGITPDQSAVDYWGGQLATQPASVVSGDFYRTLVDNWYKDYLGWSGDLQGINYWADQVEKIGAQKAFEDFAREAGIPGYAMGGLASGLSLVGERGPELVDFTNPGRVYSNDVLANVMRRVSNPDANSSALVAEVKALREEVKALREQNNAGNQAIVQTTAKTGDRIADATERGVHAAALAR